MKKKILNLLMLVTILGTTIGCSKSNNVQSENVNENLSLMALDLTPSIELFITSDEKISSANAINDEAKEMLKDIDLTNDSLEEGVAEIIDASISSGYMSNLEDGDILITTDKNSKNEASKIKSTTLNAIDKKLKEKSVSANIATQEIDITQNLIDKAQKEGVSFGKLYAVDELKNKGYEGIGTYQDASIKYIIKLGNDEKIFDDVKLTTENN